MWKLQLNASTPSPMSDLSSISLSDVCRGDPAAWQTFVTQAGPTIRATIWRVLSRSGRTDECADVLQEVFVRLVRDNFRLLRQYDPERAKLTTWLSVVANSCAIDWLRKSPDHEPLENIAEHHLAATETADYDTPLVLPPDLLPARQMLILKLLYEDDMDVAEVAERLHIEAQTVRSLRHKAINRLRNWLKNERKRG